MKWKILLGSVYHTVRGKEGRRDKQDGAVSLSRDGQAMPTAFPFQNTKEVFVTCSVFWLKQETPDPSLKAGELKQSVSR